MALSTAGKITAAFLAGSVMTGGIAVATSSNTPITRVCVANSTKAIYFTEDGKCSRNRTLMPIGGAIASSTTSVATIAADVVEEAIAPPIGIKVRFLEHNVRCESRHGR